MRVEKQSMCQELNKQTFLNVSLFSFHLLKVVTRPIVCFVIIRGLGCPFLDIALAISYELLAEQFSQTNFDSIFGNIFDSISQ